MHYSKEYCDNSDTYASSAGNLMPKKYKRNKRKPNASNEDGGNPFLRAILKQNRRKLPEPKQIFINSNLLRLISNPDMNSIYNVVEYKTLDKYSRKFGEIQSLFPPSLNILKIERVSNPFLKLSFELKRKYIYSDVKPLTLFHGTKHKYIHSICTYNFNWRLNGTEKGHRYGQGVNFTPKPKFAMNFCERTDVKVVILADVLVIKKAIGKENLQVPPKGCDTTIRENNSTYVKFCDSEFYPSYLIFFHKM